MQGTWNSGETATTKHFLTTPPGLLSYEYKPVAKMRDKSWTHWSGFIKCGSPSNKAEPCSLNGMYRLAQAYVHNSWDSILKFVERDSSFSAEASCSLGIISTFTGRLEIISIPCNKRLFLISIICYKGTCILCQIFN